MNFAENLQQVRHQRQMTQADVAEQLHVSRKTISSWETGRTYPDIETLVHISDVYQVSLDNLLKEDLGMLQHYQTQTQHEKRRQVVGYYATLVNIVLLFLDYFLWVTGWNWTHGWLSLTLLVTLIVLSQNLVGVTGWRQQKWAFVALVVMLGVVNTALIFKANGALLTVAPPTPFGKGNSLAYISGALIGRGISVALLTWSGIAAIFERVPRPLSQK